MAGLVVRVVIQTVGSGLVADGAQLGNVICSRSRSGGAQVGKGLCLDCPGQDHEDTDRQRHFRPVHFGKAGLKVEV